MSGPASRGMPPSIGDDVELAHEVFAALAGEKDALAVGRPVQHGVVGRVDRQPLDRAAAGGDHVDVHVPLAVGGERDRIGRRGRTAGECRGPCGRSGAGCSCRPRRRSRCHPGRRRRPCRRDNRDSAPALPRGPRPNAWAPSKRARQREMGLIMDVVPKWVFELGSEMSLGRRVVVMEIRRHKTLSTATHTRFWILDC